MKISTKGRYAVRAMLDLAIHYGEGPVLLKDISVREGISQRYLEQLLIPLKAAGMASAIRGSRGGFILARDPREIRISDIIKIMEGSTSPVECVDNKEVCPQVDYCVTREIWVDVKKAVDKILESTTLADLVVRKQNAQKQVEMFCI